MSFAVPSRGSLRPRGRVARVGGRLLSLSWASPTVRRETDPRRALLEHEHEVALELADRYFEMREEGWFSDWGESQV